MPGHERYRKRGREEQEEGVRGHGNVTSCRQTLICRPYYHIRGVSPLPFLPFFFFSSSGRVQWLSFSWKTSSKVTSCFDELFRSLFFFFFYLECCARNCHFGGSLFGVMYLIFFFFNPSLARCKSRTVYGQVVLGERCRFS